MIFTAKGNPYTNPPDVSDKREVVSAAISIARHFSDMKPVAKRDTEACKKRIDQFFGYCMNGGVIPTVEGLASALRVSRMTLNNWEHDRDCENGKLVSQAKADISTILTQLSVTGSINPIFPMFLLKCNHGYVEPRAEMVVELKPGAPSAPVDREAIAAEFGNDCIEDITGDDLPQLPEFPTMDIVESEE